MADALRWSDEGVHARAFRALHFISQRLKQGTATDAIEAIADAGAGRAGIFEELGRVAAVQAWVLLRSVPSAAEHAADGFEFAAGISSRSREHLDAVAEWSGHVSRFFAWAADVDFARGSGPEQMRQREEFLEEFATAIIFAANRLAVWEAGSRVLGGATRDLRLGGV